VPCREITWESLVKSIFALLEAVVSNSACPASGFGKHLSLSLSLSLHVKESIFKPTILFHFIRIYVTMMIKAGKTSDQPAHVNLIIQVV
jgi:hypothetical protein